MQETVIARHSSLINFLQRRWLILALSLIVTLLPVPYVIANWTPMGDEPHYLLAAHSLVHDGDLDAVIFLFNFLRREGCHERIKYIACACAMYRRNGERVA